MAFYKHLTTYQGLDLATFTPETEKDLVDPATGGRLPVDDVEQYAWAVRSQFEESFDDVWERFTASVDTTRVTAMVIGYWGADYDDEFTPIVELLVREADKFPALRSLFVGDIVMEEAEASWINHSDLTPLFGAFPKLERLDVRGSAGLTLEPFRHETLRTLRFETGGLPAEVVRAVTASDLPALEHLDLWLGTDNYGGDATPDDLAPLLAGDVHPKLRHLGLENAEIADQVAAAVAPAPLVARLESLSLACGALTDTGAESLLSGQPLTHLRKLDLHHHFLSDAVVGRLRSALPGVAIDLADQNQPDGDWFSISVSE